MPISRRVSQIDLLLTSDFMSWLFEKHDKLHTCLGIDRISLLRFVHNNLWFIETVNSCAMCLEPKRAMACARCWKGRFAEPNNAYSLYCSLPNIDCGRIRETRFIGMLKVSPNCTKITHSHGPLQIELFNYSWCISTSLIINPCLHKSPSR